MPSGVTIIVPCRNEARFIDGFLESVLALEHPPGVPVEMIIADGVSADGTRAVLDACAQRNAWIRVIDNPGKIVSTGLNRALGLAAGDVIVRLDVHAHYAADYLIECLALLRETGADNVGGPARTRARGYVQRAIAAAFHSPLSTGGAHFHDVNYEGFADTVQYGCWPRAVFDRVGPFDETLVRNQDDEHNLRITRAGGRIFQSPRIRCWYEPRSSLSALFRQYAQYGYWKVAVIRKHGETASWRHIAPAAFIVVLLLLLIEAPAGLMVVAAAYLLASVVICIPAQWKLLPVMPLVLAMYHVSYGLGFLWASPMWLRRPSPRR